MTGRRRTMWSVMLGGACTVAIVAMSAPARTSAPLPPGERPECPHTWPRSISLKVDEIVNTVLVPGDVVAGPTFPSRDIPEFNDCQRILLPENAPTAPTSYGGPPTRYGPLMSLFASERLAELDSLGALPGSNVIAAVQVFNYAPAFQYHPLGILPLYNCLYVWGKPGVRQARMIWQRTNPGCPAVTAASLTTRGTPLHVVDAPQGVFTSRNDYPVAARWEWDATTNTQYIGLRCGADHWCFVGRRRQGTLAEFRPEASYINVPTSGPVRDEDRVRYIRGWNDRQRLAMETPAGLVPSGVVGWVFPAPDLRTYDWQAFRDTFRLVGHIALEADSANAPGVSYYKRKFNYDLVPRRSPLRAMTQLALCLGTVAKCGVPRADQDALLQACAATTQDAASLTGPTPGGVVLSSIVPPLDPKARWIMRVRSRSGETRYKCVTRRVDPHAGTMPMPATTRWRWLPKDETTWDYCGMGCCEMSAK